MVEEHLPSLRRQSAESLVNAYMEKMEGMDGDCPTWNQGADQAYWYDTCTASSGVEFTGYGTHSARDGMPDADGNSWTGYQVYSLGELTDAGGALKTNGGAVYLTGVNSAGYGIFYSRMDAGFSLEGSSD